MKNVESKKQKIDAAFRALFTMYKNNKLTFVSIDIVRFISAALASLLPYYLAKIVTSKGDVDIITTNATILFLVMIAHGILWACADYILAYRVTRSLYKFREIFYLTTWQEPYSTFISRSSGKTASSITRLQDNANAMYISYNYNFITLIASVPVLTALLYKSFINNALIYIIFLLAVVVVLKLQVKMMKKTRAISADKNTTADSNIFDSFTNFVNVFSFRAHKKEFAMFNNANNELADARVKAEVKAMTFWASAAFLARVLLWGYIIFFNIYLFSNDQISFNQFVLSITVLIEFSNLFWRLVGAYETFVDNTSSYNENYHYLFNNRNVVKEYYSNTMSNNETEDSSINFDQTIKFNNLSFAYPDRSDKTILQNINLEINKGEKIGIVGKSGSGKSTLVKLLLGFYDVYGIAVDGNLISKEELAKINCYVPQDTTLFQQSVEFNIAYAKNEIVTHEEVVAAAKKAHAHDFIINLKNGYETLVGERGIKLSLGQRQRIALARAFLKDSQLLILDEATSSLDSKTEALVQESLEELWKNRTVVAVAHRLSTLNNVDRIIVMDNGEIVEQGSKAELLAMNGHFSELWNHQANGMIIEDDGDDIEDEV